MSSYGFEYFCGANVTLSVEGLPLLEAAGINYEVTDSRMPIYGYSSRHYDAVAEGQVLVQGTLLVNFVHQDYLFRAIQRAVGQVERGEIPQPILPGDQEDLNALTQDYETAVAFIKNMKAQYWSAQNATQGNFSAVMPTYSPHDIVGGLDLTIAFGAQGSLMPAGQTSVLLHDVHFRGRSMAIRIDEDVVVEAYPFFARDVFSLRNKPLSELPGVTQDEDGGLYSPNSTGNLSSGLSEG